VIDYQAAPTPPVKKTGGNPLMLIVSGVLAVVLIAVGVLYVMEMGKLKKANDNIASLETNVTSLEGQLATEKASVASLQTQLAAEKANVATLQTQLATAKSDLTASQAKVTSLTAELATANGKVTTLTADLATANGKVTTTQASLDKANLDLAAALVTNTTQAATIKTIQYPRHFNSYAELTNFLAQDDTNTNPAYSGSANIKAYILEVKALRAGFILPAYITWDTYYIYLNNIALVGDSLYKVTPSTDAVTYQVAFATAPPSYPIPLP